MEQSDKKAEETKPNTSEEVSTEETTNKDEGLGERASTPTQDTGEEDSSDLASPEWKEELKKFEEEKIEGEPEMPLPDKDTVEALNALLEATQKGQHIIEAIDPTFKKNPLPSQLKDARLPEVNGDFLCGTMWRREPTEGLEMIDKGITERQRQVLKWALKNAGRRLLEGKSIVNMSLPIIIASKDTSLQRAATQCGYAPIFLTKAGQQRMVTEAFKQVLTYFFVSHHIGISQEKPFNPILGETYEGYLNGIPVYGEQISHHPPISSILIKTEDFELLSHWNLEIVLAGPNSARAVQMGRVIVRLPKLNMEVIGLYAPANISGTAIGKRMFNWTEKLRAYDPNNNLYAEINFNVDDKGFVGNLFSGKSKEADKVTGNFYQLKPGAIDEFHSKKPKSNTKWNFEPEKHVARVIAPIEGKWTRNLTIGGKTYWNVEDPAFKPFLLIDAPNKTLPSDSNYREDLIYRKLNNFETGQIAKEKMEEVQRADRKLRGEGKGGKDKH